MSQAITKEDLFSIMKGYEDRLTRLERANQGLGEQLASSTEGHRTTPLTFFTTKIGTSDAQIRRSAAGEFTLERTTGGDPARLSFGNASKRSAPAENADGVRIKTYGEVSGLGVAVDSQWYLSQTYHQFYTGGTAAPVLNVQLDTTGAYFLKQVVSSEEVKSYKSVFANINATSDGGVFFGNDGKIVNFGDGWLWYRGNYGFRFGSLSSSSWGAYISSGGDVNAATLKSRSQVEADNWFVSNGATGWRNSSYGGGWYMYDSSWIRTYGGKNVAIEGVCLAYGLGSSSYVRLNGGLYLLSSGAPYFQAYNNTYHDVALRSEATGTWGHLYAGSFNSQSDRRFKKNLKPLESYFPEGPLARLMRVKTYHFEWKNELNQDSYGVIADEIEEVYPDLVTATTDPQKPDEEPIQGVNYNELVAVVIPAVQELAERVRRIEFAVM